MEPNKHSDLPETDRQTNALSKIKEFWIGALIIFAATLVVYWPAIHGGFIWDDTVSLVENPLIPRRDGLYYFWCTTAPYDYFPLTFTSFWIEYRLWGLNPFGFHVVNVVLHIGSCIILWRILRRLKIPGAFIAAMVFALHPQCVASVAWIAERKNTLSMLFCLASLLSYLHYDDSRNRNKREDLSSPAGESASPSQLFYWISLISFLLALLSKSSVVGFPAFLLLLCWWQRGRVAWRDVLRIIPYLFLSACLGLVTIWFQAHRAMGGEAVVQHENLLQRIAAAGVELWFYLYKAVLPVALSVNYPRWDFTSATALSFIPIGLFIGLFIWCWKFRQTWGRHLILALGAFVLTIAPTLGFVDMFYLTYSRVADQWVYLALPPIITLLIASIVSRSSVGSAFVRRMSIPGMTLIMVALAFLTFQRSHVYANEEALWSDTIKKNPASWCAYNNLGLALLKHGELNRAKTMLEKGLEIKPDSAEALNNMGFLLDKLGDKDQAGTFYERSVQIAPQFALAFNNWGVNLFERRQTNEAIAKLHAALEFNPTQPAANANLANYLLRKGSPQEALPYALNALQAEPENPDSLYSVGNCWLLSDNPAKAIEYYQTACRLRPAFADAEHNLAIALRKLGQTNEAGLHTAREAALRPSDLNLKLQQGTALVQAGRIQEAADQFRDAVRLQPRNSDSHDRLGFMLANQGKLNEAIQEFQAAVRLDPKNAGAHKDLGNALAQTGNTNQGLAELEEALRLEPTNALTHLQLAEWLAGAGNERSAASHFEETLRLDQDNARAHYGLANWSFKQGDIDSAREHYAAAVKSRPEFAEAQYQLALVFQMKRDFKSARDHLTEAVRLKSDWLEAVNNLAWLLATSQDPSLRDGNEAVRLAKHAVDLTKGKDPEQLDTLAAALAEKGDYTNSVAVAERAIAIAIKSTNTDLADKFRTRLKVYQKNQPYRE